MGGVIDNILLLKQYIKDKTCKQLEALDNRVRIKNKFIKKIYKKLYTGGVYSVLWLFCHGIRAKDWRRMLFYYIAVLVKK